MMKKHYIQPETTIIVIQSGSLMITGSVDVTLGDGGSGSANDGLSRRNNFWDEDELVFFDSYCNELQIDDN